MGHGAGGAPPLLSLIHISGYECGLTIEKFNDIKEGDIVEAFTMEEIPQ